MTGAMKRANLFACFLLLLVVGGLVGFAAGKLMEPEPEGEVIFWRYSGTVQNIQQEEHGASSIELRLDVGERETTLYFPPDVHRFGEIKLADLKIGGFYDICVNFVEYDPQVICLSYEITER